MPVHSVPQEPTPRQRLTRRLVNKDRWQQSWKITKGRNKSPAAATMKKSDNPVGHERLRYVNVHMTPKSTTLITNCTVL